MIIKRESHFTDIFDHVSDRGGSSLFLVDLGDLIRFGIHVSGLPAPGYKVCCFVTVGQFLDRDANVRGRAGFSTT